MTLTQTDLTQIGQLIKEEAEVIIAQISQAIGKVLENMATKDDLKAVESRLSDRINGVENGLSEVKFEVRDLKREVNDLKMDTPTVKEFQDLKNCTVSLEKIHPGYQHP